MHNLQMAQGEISNQFFDDLESVLRKLSSSRLPMQQNNLAIFLSCETLLNEKHVFDFNVKKSGSRYGNEQQQCPQYFKDVESAADRYF